MAMASRLLRLVPIGMLTLAALGFGPESTPVQAVANAPRIALRPPAQGHGGVSTNGTYGWASSNWSGYAITGGPYTSITGQWTVPTVTKTKGNTYSSTWIGIDGFNNSSLIQTGTEQDASGSGTSYYAWWEILPAAETTLPNPVSPGDAMSASIQETSPGQWTISLTDQTKGWTATEVENYSGPGTSAEWIEEAPTIGGHVATLANYGQTAFDLGMANGHGPGLVTSDGGVMIQRRVQVSTPSVPDADADGFGVAYGSAAPSPPIS